MNMKRTLLASTIVGMFFSAAAMSAELGDQYDPYITSDQVEATVSMPTREAERLADQYDPFILNQEIVAVEGCKNPANELIANQYEPFVTVAELQQAEQNRKC